MDAALKSCTLQHFRDRVYDGQLLADLQAVRALKMREWKMREQIAYFKDSDSDSSRQDLVSAHYRPYDAVIDYFLN